MSPDFPTLPDLASLAGKLPPRDFVERFGAHYLITEVVGSAVTVNPDRIVRTTEIGTFKASQQRGILGVSPVQKRDGVNPYTSMITLGRARNNDVPITDISVSKLHAWIRRGESGSFASGEFSITDAGSRNGTFVNGVAVSREPHPLPVGARLRLGLVEFWFVDGPGLYQALRAAGPLPSASP